MADLSTYLEEYLAGLDNLPAELEHYLMDLRQKDMEFEEIRAGIWQKENMYYRWPKGQVGAEKEKETLNQIQEQYAKAEELSEEKIRIADRCFVLVDRHIKRMDEEVSKLRDDWNEIPFDVRNMNVDVEAEIAKIYSSYGSSLLNLSSYARKSPKPLPQVQTRTVTATPTPFQKVHQATPSVVTATTYLPNTIATTTPQVQTDQFGISTHPGQPVVHGTTPGSIISSSVLSTRKRKMSTTTSSASQRRTKRQRSTTPDESPPPPLSIVKKEPVLDSTPEEDENADNTPYCFCHQVSYGDMVACDDENCEIEWFHWDCVGLKEQPEGTWYCKTCTQRRKEKGLPVSSK